jgi:hypothetical protein
MANDSAPVLQIVVTMGQSLTVGTTRSPAVLSTVPTYANNVLALNFGSHAAINDGWLATPVNPADFLGFTALHEMGSETQLTSMLNTVVADYNAAGQTSPTFLSINTGAGGRSILQLMTPSSETYTSLDLALANTQAGQEFAVNATGGTYDFYLRTPTSATYIENWAGPLPFFDNLVQQISLAVQYGEAQGYQISPTLVFNFEQGQSDTNLPNYQYLLGQLFNQVQAAAQNIIGPNATVDGIVSQIRSFTNSIAQLDYYLNNPNIALGVSEYQYEAEYPSKVGVDYLHLSPQGYYMEGQALGNQLYGLLSGNPSSPILINGVQQTSSTQLLIGFSGVKTYLVNDPGIYASANKLVPPPNLGFGAYSNIYNVAKFSVSSATIVGANTVQLNFNTALSGIFLLYLGRTPNDLLNVSGGGLPGFGGSTLRDASTTPALQPSSGQSLSDPNVYDYAPIQYVNIAAGAVTVAQARSLASATEPVFVLSGAYVSDNAVALGSLTAQQIDALSAEGFSGLASTTAYVTLNVSQASALENLGWRIAVNAGVVQTLQDTAQAIQGLTTAQILGLANLGVTKIVATVAGVKLTVLQAEALEAAVLTLTAPSGKSNSILDQATQIQTLAASQIAALRAAGVTSIVASDASVLLTVAQAVALVTAKLVLSAPPGSTVGVSDTAADIEKLTPTQIAALRAAGVASIVASDASVALTVAQAVALDTASFAVSVPSGAAVSLSDTAANIVKLTAAQIAALPVSGALLISASDARLALTVAQAKALEGIGASVLVTAGDTAILSDTAANLVTLTAAHIAALPALGVSALYASNAPVSYNAAQTAAIVASGLAVAAKGASSVTENFADGGYQIYANGVLTQQKIVASDGSYEIAYTHVTGQLYSSDEFLYNASATREAVAYDNLDGTGRILLYGPGLTISASALSESVTLGSNTFALAPHSVESITATGQSSETFAFAAGFGQDTIAGFAATGAGHDILQFAASSFSYLTLGLTQAQDLAAVLSHATISGNSTVISDSFGDSVTLSAVAKTTLTANPADFKFV